jgi:LexA-binding, inner membrane-associated putative hydrolase
MKGIAHFASGLAAAALVPGVAERAAEGSLLIALGGLAAMLPDWLDFRFARFLSHRDIHVAPATGADAQAAAAQLLASLQDAWSRARAGTTWVVQLHPLRVGVNAWVTWSLRFAESPARIEVTVGESVVWAETPGLSYGYDGALEIGELGGPALTFAPLPAGGVSVSFLAWHRAWSHSLVLAAALGLCLAVCVSPLAGWVSGLGYAVHVLEDQLGYMGSNLFWPFTRTRGGGLRWMHSGDTLPNALTVWLSLMLVLLRLDQARATPVLDAAMFAVLAVLLPLVGGAAWLWRKRNQSSVNADALAEAGDAGLSGRQS